MDKRAFIKLNGLLAGTALLGYNRAQSESLDPLALGFPRNINKPVRLRKGDRVMVLAPGTNVTDPVLIKKAEKNIQELGFQPIISDTLTSKHTGHNSNNSDYRAEAINKAFEDESIRAIWCIRGGYGSMDLLTKLDYDSIAQNPKLFIGYSDITALHSALYLHSGLITLHGPVALSKQTEFTLKGLQNLLFSGLKGDNIELLPKDRSEIRFTLNNQTVKGRLLGGNLSLISAITGTEYLPSFEQAIVFLEDVGEAPYRLHRMLKQLELAGKFNDIKALIVGKCDGCNRGDSHVSDYTENEAYLDIVQSLQVPVGLNNLIGHTENQTTLPHGLMVEYHPEEYYLQLTEDLYQ